MGRRILIVLGVSVLLLMILPVAVAFWVVYTDAGLRFTANRLEQLSGDVRIHIAGVHGALASGIQVDHLRIDVDPVSIVIDNIHTGIKPASLLVQTIDVTSLDIGKLQVRIFRRQHPASDQPLRFLPQWLHIVFASAKLSKVSILLPNGHTLTARRITADANIHSQHINVRNLRVDAQAFTLAGNLELGAANPLQLIATLDWTLPQVGRAKWQGIANLSGDLNELRVNARQVAPIRASLTGRALALTLNWHWEAQVESPSIDFAALSLAPIVVRDLAVSVTGDSAGIALRGSVTPITVATGPLQITARGPYPDQRVQLDALSVTASGGTRLEAAGVLDFTSTTQGPAIDVHGRTDDFRWPLQIGPQNSASSIRVGSARFALEGRHLPYHYTADGDLILPRVPSIVAQLSGELTHDFVSIEKGTARWLNGTLTANGVVSWSGNEAWHLNLTGHDVNPRSIDPAWPGQLALALQASGNGFGEAADLEVALKGLSGRLRNEDLRASGHFKRRQGEYRLDNIIARLGSAHLSADGKLGQTHDLRVSFAADQLQRLLPHSSGAVDLQGQISGPAAAARLTAKINARALQVLGVEASRINLNLDLDLSDRLASKLDLKADDVALMNYRVGTISASLDGSASAHHFIFKTEHGAVQIDAALDGSYAAKSWQGSITRFALSSNSGLSLNLATPAQLRATPQRIAWDSLCLVHYTQHFCTQGDWQRSGTWNLLANAADLPLSELGGLFANKSTYSGSLGLDANLHAQTNTGVTGDAAIDLHDGRLTYKSTTGREETLHLGNGHAQMHASAQQLEARVHLGTAQYGVLNANLSGLRAAAGSLFETPIKGEIHTEAHELAFVPLWVPEIDRMEGQLNADLTVAGTLGAPQFDGALVLKDSALDIYSVNLSMRQIGARIDVAGPSLKLGGQANVGEGKAQISGNLSWSLRSLQGNVKLSGTKLRMVDIPELRVDASPDLDFKIDGRRIDVSGSVTIPSARMRPTDLTGAVRSSGDEVIVGDISSADDQRLQIYSNLRLVLGKDVNVESYGLRGRLAGEVTVTSGPDGVTRGSGELNIDEGKYTAYGRQLDIERGRLIFTGGFIDDPAVDLRAVKVFPDVTAGVNVRGKLRNPQISFFSDPSLTQSQIVSLLVAGGSLESLQKNGSQQAGGDLLLQGGAIVGQQIGARIGVDDVGVETDTLNQTSLVLGKFLNPRLYVSYGVSLTQSINTVKLRYTLGDHWTIKLEAGEARSSDLVYTIER